MTEDERVRMAAEVLLSGSINSQRSSVTQQSITRTPDIVLSEDLIAGARQNGRMSNVRRFFCLFVTFDLFFTFLMWLICIMVCKTDDYFNRIQHIACSNNISETNYLIEEKYNPILYFYFDIYLRRYFANVYFIYFNFIYENIAIYTHRYLRGYFVLLYVCRLQAKV